MQWKKKFIVNGIVIGLLLVLTGVLVYNNVSQKNTIKKDNMILYLGTDGSVMRSQELEAEKVKKIAIYFPETNPTNYANHERYQIFLDDQSFMETMYERTTKTGDIFAAYVFYPGKKYSQNFLYAVKQEYVFNPARDNAIEYSIEYLNNNTKKQILHYYEYYPNTKFNEAPENNIKMIYSVDDKGFLESAIEVEKGTGKELKKHYYKPNTVYDDKSFAHRNNVAQSEPIIGV